MVRKTSSLFQLPLLVAIVTLWSAAWALGNQNDQAPTVRLGKRNSPSDTDSHEQELYNYLDDLFTSDVRDTVGRLQSAQYRPLLVHTSDMQVSDPEISLHPLVCLENVCYKKRRHASSSFYVYMGGARVGVIERHVCFIRY